MFSHGWRIYLIALTFVSLSAGNGWATNIKTKTGQTYSNVTILRRNGGMLEISGPGGKVIQVPLTNISELDGVQLAPPPASAPSSPLPTATNRPAVLPATMTASQTPLPPSPARSAATPARIPTTTSGLLYPTPAGVPIELPATPTPQLSASAKPTSSESTRSTSSARSTPSTGPHPTENADEGSGWITWLIVLGVILWIASIVLISVDSSRRKVKSSWWFYIVYLLPVAGGLGYLVGGRKTKSGPARPNPARSAEPFAEFQFLNANHDPIEIKPGAEASGIQNAKDILNDALLDRASDVHIEPSGSEYRVRFRVDGMLYPRMKFPPEEGMRLVSAVKSLAEMDIAEKRKAQDGRFGGKRGSREVDFRVATTPSVFGEKLVVRVLDSKTGLRGLNELGMTEEMMGRFAQVIQSRNGMILATGPTGSGKTSTLYAALAQLDSEGLNLVTIEDPVEYQLSGATQIPVNPRAGVTYESGLRSVLRQDPDVILVGEMRDREAAQIALRSALTGHLVFSSLHTQNAIGTITRLEEMGIERHLLASSLFVVIAQRLVRITCPHCRESYACKGDELAEVGLELPEGTDIFRAKGCRRCDGTGYLGRTGVFEMLIFDEELRQAVNDGQGETAIYELAYRKGYRNYREDAAMKVLLGMTTVDEVMKAI